MTYVNRLQGTFSSIAAVVFLASVFLAVPGCGESTGVVADQDELSKYIESHPELKNSSADEAATKSEEPSPVKQGSKRSDA